MRKFCPYCLVSYYEKGQEDGNEKCLKCNKKFLSTYKDGIFLAKKLEKGVSESG